jgi:membrane-bound lytic murein transglycosylase B
MKRTFCLALLLLLTAPARADYSTDPRAEKLYAMLQSDYGFSASELASVKQSLAQAQKRPEVVSTEQNAKERTLTWDAYQPIHVNPANVAAGTRFLQEQHKWLARAEAQYGVPPQVVAAVLGVETKYGSFTGRYRALDTLATMAFDHPTRGDFFMSELAQLFVLCRQDRFDAATLTSSYAGALGAAQFMPSNYLKLGVDFDGDGRVDLWSAPDAIGSIANYLAHYRPDVGWRRGQPLYVAAHVGGKLATELPRNTRAPQQTAGALARAGVTTDEPLPGDLSVGLIELTRSNGADYWLALPNFYSVMSYNPRVFYAASVAALADALAQAPPQVAQK